MLAREIDLEFGDGRSRPWMGLLLLVAGVLAAIVGASLHHQQSGHLRRAQAELRHLQRPARGPAVPPAPNGEQRLQQGAEAELLRPWPTLLHAIENSSHARVRLLSVEPDVRTGSVSIVGLAQDFEAIAAYQGQLSAAGLTRVSLSSHARSQGAADALRFVLLARWTEPGALPSRGGAR